MMQSKHNLRYDRCMLLAGGGFRFGYYLGMHAAAVEAGQAPDVLLATCGGALAGAIIAGLPDTASRKAWLASPQMYAFLSELDSGPRASPLRAFFNVGLRRLRRAAAPRIPHLHSDYLFEIPPLLPLPGGGHAGAVSLAILGGRLLFDAHEAGQLRGNRALYEVTLFCDQRAAALVSGQLAAMHGCSNAIAERVGVDSTVPVADAARISIADIFYFACQSAHGKYYTGGAIDLMPLELGRQLAHHVTMEIKQPYDKLMAIPALRAAYGIDGNLRMRDVHAQHADVWIDTSDAATVLRGTGVQKAVDWRSNRLRLFAPASYDQYVSDVEAQWRYGYERAQKAYQQ